MISVTVVCKKFLESYMHIQVSDLDLNSLNALNDKYCYEIVRVKKKLSITYKLSFSISWNCIKKLKLSGNLDFNGTKVRLINNKISFSITKKIKYCDLNNEGKAVSLTVGDKSKFFTWCLKVKSEKNPNGFEFVSEIKTSPVEHSFEQKSYLPKADLKPPLSKSKKSRVINTRRGIRETKSINACCEKCLNLNPKNICRVHNVQVEDFYICRKFYPMKVLLGGRCSPK